MNNFNIDNFENQRNLHRPIICTLILLFYLSSNIHAQPYFPVRVNKLWGVIDSSGKIVLKPSYDKLYVYGKNNNFLSAQSGDSTYLINSNMQIIARTNYAAIKEHGEGMFRNTLRSKRYYPSFYGLMDSTGKIITEPKFSLMEPFNDGVAKVNVYIDTTGNYKKKNEKSGIIDKNGNWIVQPIYKTHQIKSSSEGLINYYQKEEGWGAMDVNGNTVLEPKYNWLGPCNNGLMEYGIIGKYGTGLMKRDEKVVIPDDGKIMVSYRPKSKDDTLVVVHTLKATNDFLGYKYIDSKIYTISGEYLFESKYGSECSQQCNGFFQVSDKRMKRGMMNSLGDIVVEPKYDVLQWFQRDLKQVKIDNKWGFINDSGNETIPCIYDETKPFDNGLAAIYIGGKWSDYIFPDKNPNVKMGYINRKGEIIWEPSW